MCMQYELCNLSGCWKKAMLKYFTKCWFKCGRCDQLWNYSSFVIVVIKYNVYMQYEQYVSSGWWEKSTLKFFHRAGSTVTCAINRKLLIVCDSSHQVQCVLHIFSGCWEKLFKFFQSACSSVAAAINWNYWLFVIVVIKYNTRGDR